MTSSILSYPPPPAGFNYLAVIRPSLKLMLLCSAWSSALVPLLFALFLFSSRSLRRTPIFMLNVVSIIMGLALGVLAYYNGVSVNRLPLNGSIYESRVGYGNSVSGRNNPRCRCYHTSGLYQCSAPLHGVNLGTQSVDCVSPQNSTSSDSCDRLHPAVLLEARSAY